MKMRWKLPKSIPWVQGKRAELEQRLRVPISVYYAHDQVNFAPYLDHTKVQAVSAPTMEAILLERLQKCRDPLSGQTFMALHESTGWPFDEIFAVSLSLVHKSKAYPQTDRAGKFVGIYIRRP